MANSDFSALKSCILGDFSGISEPSWTFSTGEVRRPGGHLPPSPGSALFSFAVPSFCPCFISSSRLSSSLFPTGFSCFSSATRVPPGRPSVRGTPVFPFRSPSSFGPKHICTFFPEHSAIARVSFSSTGRWCRPSSSGLGCAHRFWSCGGPSSFSLKWYPICSAGSLSSPPVSAFPPLSCGSSPPRRSSRPGTSPYLSPSFLFICSDRCRTPSAAANAPKGWRFRRVRCRWSRRNWPPCGWTIWRFPCCVEAMVTGWHFQPGRPRTCRLPWGEIFLPLRRCWESHPFIEE